MIELAEIRKKSRKQSGGKKGTTKKSSGKRVKKSVKPTRSKKAPSGEVTPPIPEEDLSVSAALPDDPAPVEGDLYVPPAGEGEEGALPDDLLPAEVIADEEVETSLHFAVRNEYCALPIDDIVEVIDVPSITAVPNAPEEVIGIVSLRGIVVTVIDMGAMLDHKATNVTEESKIIILKRDENFLGFLVDRVFRTLSIPVNAIENSPVVGEWGKIVRGLYSHEKKIIMILESDKLV